MDEMIRGTAAGVPFLARPPEHPTDRTPLLVGWHMLDPPRTETAMAAALPMADVPAWRVYLRLPECGDAARRAAEDYVLMLIDPVVSTASGVFPTALSQLRSQLETDGSLGLFGGSAGGAVALQVLTEQDVDVGAAALVNPIAQLEPVADSTANWFGTPFRWCDESRAAAARLDFVARADELRRRHPELALLLVRGDEDEPEFREPLGRLAKALDAELIDIPGLDHALATELAPGNDDARRVDEAFSDWFRRYLIPPLL
jgi:pimeloyl-ACP methyl ester carboxylesterase